MDQYNCNVKFIGGHNPDLVLSGPSSVERIDLTQYKSTEDLHGLFASKRHPAGDGEGRIIASCSIGNPYNRIRLLNMMSAP